MLRIALTTLKETNDVNEDVNDDDDCEDGADDDQKDKADSQHGSYEDKCKREETRLAHK